MRVLAGKVKNMKGQRKKFCRFLRELPECDGLSWICEIYRRGIEIEKGILRCRFTRKLKMLRKRFR